LSDHTYSYSTAQGSEYIISLSPFESDVLDGQKVKVFDLILKLITINGNDNYDLLNHLANLVFKFLEENGGIVYFYSDNAPILKSKNNSHLSNQEYRNKLFRSMFERLKRKAKIEGLVFEYIMRTTIVKDSINGDHFISLISKSSEGQEIEDISNMILAMNDK